MFAKTIVAVLALTLSVSALQITNPSNTTGWESSGSQLIEWDTVSTDPSNFTIQLIDPSNPNAPITIAQSVNSGDKQYTYTPSSDLAAADQYRVNFVSDGAGILAQSGYFAVEDGTSTVSATASASATSASASASAAATSAASTAATSGASAASQDPSASSSAAPSSSATGAASHLVAPGGLLLLLAGAIASLA